MHGWLGIAVVESRLVGGVFYDGNDDCSRSLGLLAFFFFFFCFLRFLPDFWVKRGGMEGLAGRGWLLAVGRGRIIRRACLPINASRVFCPSRVFCTSMQDHFHQTLSRFQSRTRSTMKTDHT